MLEACCLGGIVGLTDADDEAKVEDSNCGETVVVGLAEETAEEGSEYEDGM
jgi:hypothetical protein